MQNYPKGKELKEALHSGLQGFFVQFWEKALAKIGKMINLRSKLGEINDMEHNKGCKIYPKAHG